MSNLGVMAHRCARACRQTAAREPELQGADGAAGGSESCRRDPERSTHSWICLRLLKCLHSLPPNPAIITMDACLQKFETSMGSEPTMVSSTENVATTPRRVAHWDSKREKCNNCELIYLKTLSQHSGFCSVDCKSNMAYLQRVNHTIRAMKDAVDERQQEVRQEPVTQQEPQQQVEVAQQLTAKLPPSKASPEVDASAPHAHSFAEFGLESRILDASNVEWAFSAVY